MVDAIALKNFKAFASLKLNLAPLTLFTGINATGKSTVMQALALLRQSNDADVLHEDGFLLNGELVELGTGQDVLHEDYVGRDDPPTIEFTIRVGSLNFTWSAAYGPEDDLLPLTKRPVRRVGNLALFGSGFQYLRADRIVPAVHYPRSYRHAIQQKFLGVQGEHTINYLREYQDALPAREEAFHPRAKSRRLLDQVNAWMQEICPGVDLQTADLHGTDLVRLHYGFFGTAGLSASHRYRPTNVGFGLTYVLPVVVAFLIAEPGSLILVENPEAHLHPRGQPLMGRMACLASKAGAQVLMESHSDHVLNGVRVAVKDGVLQPSEVAVHYFHRPAREGEHDRARVEVVSPAVGPDGMLSEWPHGFFDEWDRALDDLLT